ncbi:Flp family type IVb pilin [Qipengyuania sp. 902]|uniref:Flp family type IVb pilin n=1 Tax=Qipengyuania sp. 902 TaxID=3417565 RepID=UPI003EBD26B1
MTNFLKNFAADESGASAAEYALILVVVGLGIVLAATTLSGSISNAIQDTSKCIDPDGDSTGTCPGSTSTGGN